MSCENTILILLFNNLLANTVSKILAPDSKNHRNKGGIFFSVMVGAERGRTTSLAILNAAFEMLRWQKL